MACKPGSVLLHLCFRTHVVQRLSFICAYCCQQTIAVYPPARASSPQAPVYMTLQLPGRTAQGVTTRLVGSYPTFSPLPHRSEAVIFFYVNPAVTDTLHINKRDALCCPDFPHTPRGSKRQTVQLLSRYKISARRAKKQTCSHFSEPQPNLKLRSRLKLVQAVRNATLL